MTNRTNPLITVSQVDGALTDFLTEQGKIFKVFDKQDSGCISYGVHSAGCNWFVKYTDRPEAVAFLKNAVAFHQEAEHPSIPNLLNSFRIGRGFALVYQWVNGEVLYTSDFTGAEGRNHPASPHYRFRQLPPAKRIAALNIVFDVHAYLERKGFVAVDFYDGCMIYDFQNEELHLCDFDHYTKGAFALDMDRLYGSSRFMAPEEFVRGSRIDHLTNVYTMGAAAFVFLANDGSRELSDWKASEALYRVALKAVSPSRVDRFRSVNEFYREWLKALG